MLLPGVLLVSLLSQGEELEPVLKVNDVKEKDLLDINIASVNVLAEIFLMTLKVFSNEHVKVVISEKEAGVVFHNGDVREERQHTNNTKKKSIFSA